MALDGEYDEVEELLLVLKIEIISLLRLEAWLLFLLANINSMQIISILAKSNGIKHNDYIS